MSDRVETCQVGLAENGQAVLVEANFAQEESSKKGYGSLSLNVLEYTPTKGAASSPSLVGQLMRKKPQEFDGRISWEAYRTHFELWVIQDR